MACKSLDFISKVVKSGNDVLLVALRKALNPMHVHLVNDKSVPRATVQAAF